MHALAAVCILYVPVVWYVRGALLPILAFSLWRALRPCEILSLRLSVGEGLSCCLDNGERIKATVLPESTVFVWLVVLRLRIDEAGVRTLTLFPDQMSREEFRMLRLWLRWNRDLASPCGTLS